MPWDSESGGCVSIFKTDAFSDALRFGVSAEGKEESRQDEIRFKIASL